MDWALLSKRRLLNDAISRGEDYNQIKARINDPLMLSIEESKILGKATVPALYAALVANNWGAAQAIMDVLNDPDNEKRILAQLEHDGLLDRYCPSRNAANISYEINPGEFSCPFDVIRSPQMLKILHRGRFDLGAVNSFGIPLAYKTYIEKIAHNLENHQEGKDSDPLTLLNQMIELRIASHTPWQSDRASNLADYAYSTLCAKGIFKAATSGVAPIEREISNIGKLLMEHGIDTRHVLAGDPTVIRLSHILYEGVIDELRFYANQAPEKYRAEMKFATGSHSPTASIYPHLMHNVPKDMIWARVACAGGTFPDLLNWVVAQDKQAGGHKGFERLMGCLDDYWKHEYRNIINATLARTSPVRDSALARYVRDDESSTPGRAP